MNEDLIEAILVRQHPERRTLPCIPFRLVIDNIFIFFETKFYVTRYNFLDVFPVKCIYGYFSIDQFRHLFVLYKHFNIRIFPIHIPHEYIKSIFNIINPYNILSIRINMEFINIFKEYLGKCINITTLETDCQLNLPHIVPLPSLKNLYINIDEWDNYSLINLIEQYDIQNLEIGRVTYYPSLSLSSSFPQNLKFLTDVNECEYSKIIYIKRVNMGICPGETVNAIIELTQPDAIIGHYSQLMNITYKTCVLYPFTSDRILPYNDNSILRFNDFVSFIIEAKRQYFDVYPMLSTSHYYQPSNWTWESLATDMKKRLQ